MTRINSLLSFWLIILSSLPSLLPAEEAHIDIGRFSQNDLSGWEEKSFLGHTRYNLIQANNSTVLKAHTSSTASGMFKEIEVDLNKTPFINWSWKIENIYQGNDELSKGGDDYPARLYIVISGGLLFWQTKAINYVWSSNQAKGTTWESAYTSSSKMMAVRSGNQETNLWLLEKRNVRNDLRQLFGEEITQIHAVAIMSDSDNAKQSATSYYGDIYFSAK